MDPQGRIWFGEFRGNRLGMFDTRTQRYQEWAVPTPWTQPYDAELDNKGNVWSVNITTDRVERLDPKTGEVTEYPLPRYSSLRRVVVDNSTKPVTIWAPNKGGASIIKLEPSE